MSRRVCPVEALLRYVESDTPYYDRSTIYPHLPKIKNLQHLVKTDIRKARRHIYHVRDGIFLRRGNIAPRSGFVSCSTKKGCAFFAENLNDPVLFKVDVNKLDWYIYVPDVVHHLYRNSPVLRRRLDSVMSRVEGEKEFIVPFSPGLLQLVGSLKL